MYIRFYVTFDVVELMFIAFFLISCVLPWWAASLYEY